MLNPNSPEPEIFLLIDGPSLMFRAFYAIKGLTNRNGQPTGAIYGVYKMVEKVIREIHPKYALMAFDLPDPTFRHEEFKEYKANRAPTPPELQIQIPYVKQITNALGVTVLEKKGFEADDIIGTLAITSKKENLKCLILSPDKDLLQLVGKNIYVIHPKKEDQILDEEGVKNFFGVLPLQVPDVLGLWGDSSDNIPGVPGIGEKGAKSLISEFGSIEGIYEHLEKVKKKAYREGLLSSREQALASRELARVKTDIPCLPNPTALFLRDKDTSVLIPLLRELNFTSVLDEIKEEGKPEIKNKDYKEITLSEWNEWIKKKNEASLCYSPSLGVWSSSDGMETVLIKSDEKIRHLPDKVILFDAKSIFHQCDINESMIPKSFFDTALASYLLDPVSYPSLYNLAKKYLGKQELRDDTEEGLIQIADSIFRLKEFSMKELNDAKMLKLYEEIELPLTPVLYSMEKRGIMLDSEILHALKEELKAEISHLKKRMEDVAEVSFNPSSPKQVAEILYDHLHLQAYKKTKKGRGRSTDVDALEALSSVHPIAGLLLEYRILSKALGTYIEPLIELRNEKDFRIHARFHQMATATGRLSSSDPNLQNIPIRGEWGNKIRRAFIAPDGYLFISADYSQIELRLLACMSGDSYLIDAFKKEIDIHTLTASEVFGILPEKIDEDLRRRAKVINFGILYGMGPHSLAGELGIGHKEASAIIDRYFGRFTAVKEYIEFVMKFVEENGYVETLLHRKRFFKNISSANQVIRQALLRQAVNTTIQGTAADLIKKAMVEIYGKLRDKNAGGIVLQLHDEVVCEIREDMIDEIGRMLKEIMEGALNLSIPLTVDVSYGKNWSGLDQKMQLKGKHD